MTTNGTSSTPRIKLYTDHRCPFAHRIHITLQELSLPYEEEIVTLDEPRPQWYLELNPRGQVPTLKYNDNILTDSPIIAQFLIDAHPSHLFPTTEPDAPLKRARINTFVEQWRSEVGPWNYKVQRAEEADKEKLVKEYVGAIEKWIEPLLKNDGPGLFFGGSEKLTLAEIHAAPFVLRQYAHVKHSLLPASFKEGLDKLPNYSRWAQALHSDPSVAAVWPEGRVIEINKRRLAEWAAKDKKAKA